MQVFPVSYFGNVAEVYRPVQDCIVCIVWSQVGGVMLVIIIKELSYLSVNDGSWALPVKINSGFRGCRGCRDYYRRASLAIWIASYDLTLDR